MLGAGGPAYRNAASMSGAPLVPFQAVVDSARTIAANLCIAAWLKAVLIPNGAVKIHRFTLALVGNVKQSLQNSLSTQALNEN